MNAIFRAGDIAGEPEGVVETVSLFLMSVEYRVVSVLGGRHTGWKT